MPLTALNCIVVFSAMKVDKMVPAPAATPATLMLSQRPQPDGSEPQLASMLTSTAWVAWSWCWPHARRSRATTAISGAHPASIGYFVQVLGSLLFSCIMVGNKMLVATNIIRLRNRRAELETVLRHMRTRATTAPRELMPIQPLREANATISWV